MNIDIKATTGTFLADIKSTSAETKSPTGSFVATLSVPILDRDKEIVDPFAGDPLPDYISIDIDHAMSVEKTVASGTPSYDANGVLQFTGTYASHPLAQMVRSLVDERHIRNISVAMHNVVREIDEKDGFVHVRKYELLNAGIVAIPANTATLISASKALQKFADAHEGTIVPAVGKRDIKSVVGSFEHQRELLDKALRANYPTADWVWVRATFPDAVVFDMGTAGIEATYKVEYTVDDDEILFGDASQVELAEVVLPTKSITDTNPETKAAAADAAAATSPAVVEVAKARASQLAAELALM